MGLMTFGIALFLFGIISIVVYYASQTQTGEVVRTVSAQGEQFKGVQKTKSAQFTSLGPFKEPERTPAPVVARPEDVTPVSKAAATSLPIGDVNPKMLAPDSE